MEDQGPLKEEPILLKNRYEYLEDLIKQHNYTSFAEIGVEEGVTSRYLIQNCPSLNKVILVDPFDKIDHAFFNAIPFVTFYNKYSITASRKIEDNSLDMVYIDADHSYEQVMLDIRVWKPKVKKGGILCGHDYAEPLHPGVVRAVKESFPEGVNLLLEGVLYGLEEPADYVWWTYVK